MLGDHRWSTVFVAVSICFHMFASSSDGADTDSKNEKIKIWPNECAGHLVKSRSCGASSNKYVLECCPGLVCDGRFCVEADDKNEDVPKEQYKGTNDQPSELLAPNATQANYTSILLQLEKAREELERNRKEEERRRKEEESFRKEEEQRRQEQERVRRQEEKRRQREEKQRHKEAKAQRPEEKKALVRLYSETNGDTWNRNGGWLNDDIDQ